MGRVLGRVLVGVLVLVVVAVGAVFAFDGPLRAEVETRVADAVAAESPLEGPVEVGLGGYPVAWNLVTRRFPTAKLSAGSLPILERKLTAGKGRF